MFHMQLTQKLSTSAETSPNLASFTLTITKQLVRTVLVHPTSGE